MEAIILYLAKIITDIIGGLGYWGVGICMAIESCNVPLPSEVILPFGGYLASEGRITFLQAALAGTVGGTLGSVVSYYLGYYAIDSSILFWIPERKKQVVTEWFNRHGESTVFFSRLLPVVRTFISLPAGAAKMNLAKFIAYTFVGSLIWSLILTYLGYQLGTHWMILRKYFEYADIIILIAIIAGIAYYYRRRRTH
ncbi:MAG: DedA family protein [Syntrophomonadaceae bacterium]|jgi:membrane protein DedA with SNARE-associated domain